MAVLTAAVLRETETCGFDYTEKRKAFVSYFRGPVRKGDGGGGVAV